MRSSETRECGVRRASAWLAALPPCLLCLILAAFTGCKPQERCRLFGQLNQMETDDGNVLTGAKFFEVPPRYHGHVIEVVRIQAGKENAVASCRIPADRFPMFVVVFFTSYEPGKQSVEYILRQNVLSQEPFYQEKFPSSMVTHANLAADVDCDKIRRFDILAYCPEEDERDFRKFFPDLTTSNDDIRAYSAEHPDTVVLVLRPK